MRFSASSASNSIATRLVLALVCLRVGMGVPNIVLGIALPSTLPHELWWLFGGLAVVYAVAGWLYAASGRIASWIMLALALADISLTVVELHSDLRSSIADQRSILITSIVLDALQLAPALIVALVVAWSMRQAASAEPASSSMDLTFTLPDGRMVRLDVEDEGSS